MSYTEMRFADGNLSDVVRVGNTVRRVTGPWSPAVHALLRHLEAAGFDGAPRFLGIDERGREILSFVEGETLRPDIPNWSEDLLAGVGSLLRRYHDAVAGFTAPADAAWQFASAHQPRGRWSAVTTPGRGTW